MTSHIVHAAGRAAAFCGSLAFTGVAIYNLENRFIDCVQGKDDFARHTNEQHKKNRFSQMHQPFIPNAKQLEFIEKNFPESAHLFPRSLDDFQKQQALQTAVKIEPLKNSQFKYVPKSAGTVVVGGPPALISSANTTNITYINAKQRHPIWKGSALHLEWDAESEAPTTTRPHRFISSALYRAIFGYHSMGAAEKTGYFPWRTLDWKGWMTHPGYWMQGVRVGLAFQRLTGSYKNPQTREGALSEVSQRCKANQRYYEQLNSETGGKLISQANGSIIVARDEQEKGELVDMKSGLAKEGREIRLLSREEMQERYGFVPPNGIAFGEKTHDRILSPNYVEVLAERIEKLGGEVIDGTLTTIYVDGPQQAGFAKFKTPHGEERILPFSDLVLSLGNQQILGYNGKPLFDVVAARGVSVLATVTLPKWRELPQAIVCGGTNHVIKLGDGVEVKGEDGQIYKSYLVRMTCGACITPNVSEKESANYDATSATGLIAAVRQTLAAPIEVLTVYGCNRQVSEHGQSHWMTIPTTPPPFPIKPFLSPRGHHLDLGTHRPVNQRGVVIQMGAGGGGLTQAPAQPPSDL